LHYRAKEFRQACITIEVGAGEDLWPAPAPARE